MVLDHYEGHLQSELRSVYDLAWRSCHVHDQSIVVHQSRTFGLFQGRLCHLFPIDSFSNATSFQFVGRIIAKAVYDNKLLDCYFTRAFYKHILGKSVKYTDLESEDPDYYQSLVYLMENPVDQLGYELTFSLEVRFLFIIHALTSMQHGEVIGGRIRSSRSSGLEAERAQYFGDG